MSNIINFLQYKNEQLEIQLEELFQRRNSPHDKLDSLLQNKNLQLEDHKLFLAFLAYLEEQQLDAQLVFKDVLKLPKHQFEAKYAMNWSQVIKLSVTFLTILRTNDPQSYKQLVD
ncbi:hypothetical protein CSE16_14595 [Solibacillus sp. R5-41]|uniref:hypothetical protein n=1 Tax=Solibacillus sp. R5-41 TaxID=2048654 RepID=UPI000C12549A|nr:hypothetical protein [Solibacillus sp. R5-41]ATP42465.1 hypothetical protein CSE16_14595 [Solibacillus sp. R5-41]